MPIDPFQFHTSLSLNPFARCFGARAQPEDVEEATPASQTDLSCTCACVPFFGSARFHSAHIFAFDMFPRQLYLHVQLRLPSLYFSRVARIFQDAAVSRPELQRIIDACEAAGTETAPYRTTGALLPFPEDWVPPNVSPALARFKLSWESFVASLVREWKTLNVLSALLLSCVIFYLCARDLVTEFARQSYPDRVPDSGRGERSVDAHGCFVLSSQRADESLIWNCIYRALR